MKIPAPRTATLALVAFGCSALAASETAPSASQPWVSPVESSFDRADAPVAPPVPARPLTLGDLINLALRDNPDTRNSWHVAVQSAATLNQAQSAFLPQLTGTLGYGKQYQRTAGNLIYGPGLIVPEIQIVNTPNVAVSPGASLSWMLWDFGAGKAGYDAAKAGLIASNFQHNRTLQGVVRQVQTAYFNFDQARGGLASADAAGDVAAGTLNATLLKRRDGLAGLPDELQARQSEAQARMQREQARQSYAQARAQLLELAGLPPSATLEIAEQPAGTEPAPVVAAVDALVKQAMATRPDLAARYAKIAALEAEVRHTQRGFLPTIGFSASFSKTRGEQGNLTSQGVASPEAIQQAQVNRYNAFGFEETAQAGIQISTNLTNFYTYNHAVAEKRAQLDAARAELHTALITAQHDVWQAVDACQAARTQFAEARDLLDLSQRSFAAAQQAQESGLQSTLDVLQAQQALAQARYTLVQARAQLFTSAADLAYATGQTAMGGDADER